MGTNVNRRAEYLSRERCDDEDIMVSGREDLVRIRARLTKYVFPYLCRP
jgi:hypothetical protein